MIKVQSSKGPGKGNKAGAPKHEFARTGGKLTSGQRVSGAMTHGTGVKPSRSRPQNPSGNPFRGIVHGN